MGVALRGNLKDFGIAEVFQLIGQQTKTGVLEIEADDQKVQLAFDAGRVAWASPAGRTGYAELGSRLVRCGLLTSERLNALMKDAEASAQMLPALMVESGAVGAEDLEQIRDLVAQDTIFEVLRWQEGSFHFSTQPVHHDLPPERLLGAEQILMDGLRMLDEWQTFADAGLDREVVYRSVGSFEQYRQQASALGQHQIALAERVFRLIDGRVSAQRVMDLARLATFDGTRVLADLRAARLIEVVRQAPTRLPRESSSSTIGAQIRWWMSALCPLLVLAAVVSLALIGQRPMRQDARVLTQDPYQRAYDLFEARQLLHAVEAHRYLTGSWPQNLAQRDETGLLGRETLAPASTSPYYYAVRDGGVLLLAPER